MKSAARNWWPVRRRPDAELAQARSAWPRSKQELASNQQILESAAADLAGAQHELAALPAGSATAAAASGASGARAWRHRRAAIMEAVAAASQLRNQLTQAEERLAASIARRSVLQAEIGDCHRRRSRLLAGNAGSWRWNLKPSRSASAGLTAEISQTCAAARCQAPRRKRGETPPGWPARGVCVGSGKERSLEAVIAEHGYSTESVRRLFQSGHCRVGSPRWACWPIFWKWSRSYERVVEDFLRDELNYIVVKSWDAADEGLRLLRNDVDGRATFLVHPEDSQAKFSFVVDEAAQSGASRPVDCAAEEYYPGFGRFWQVVGSDPSQAARWIHRSRSGLGRELALENPDAFFLSHSRRVLS